MFFEKNEKMVLQKSFSDVAAPFFIRQEVPFLAYKKDAPLWMCTQSTQAIRDCPENGC